MNLLRKVAAEDLHFVHALIQDLEDQEIDPEQFSAVFLANLRSEEVFYFVIMHQQKKAGFVSLHVQPLLHHWGKVAEIQELILHKDFRNLGLGKQVLHEMINLAKSKECKLIELCTNKKRIDAQRFYRDAGWKESHFKYTCEF